MYPAPRPTPHLDRFFDEAGKLLRPAPGKEGVGSRLRELAESGRWYKTLVLSDTQGVFADDDLWTRALADHPDADLVVVPGDVADWEGASKYVHEMDYPLMLEADWLVRFYLTVTEALPNVPVLVTGSNHRRRVEKHMRSVPQGLLFLAEHNPERYLAQPFPNVVSLDPWWFQVGDVIYAHREGRTATPGDNARDAIKTFRNWRDSGQHGVEPFRVVLTGHSHKVAEFYENGVKGMEPGCLAKLPMLYTTTAEVSGTQDNGYAYVVQRGGRADRNECRVVKLSDN
jgi:predicted phosphodiesterase